MRLLLRSNPALYEWLVSPITYVDEPAFRADVRALFEAHASQRALAHHYWSIARGQWRSEIDGREAVRQKKYFYVVRPLLSLIWVVENGTPPPMSIDALLAAVPMPAAPRQALDALIERKRRTPELGLAARETELDAWGLDLVERLQPEKLSLRSEPQRNMRVDADRLFRRLIGA